MSNNETMFNNQEQVGEKPAETVQQNDQSIVQPTNQVASTPTPPELTGTIAELVGPDKKFKSVEALAQGKLESDRYVDELKERLVAAEAKADSSTTTESVLDIIREERSNTELQTENTTPTISRDDITTLIKETLSDEEKAKLGDQNLATVNKAFIDSYGDVTKAREAFATKANELGLSVDRLTEIAAESPSALLTMTGVSQLNRPSTSSANLGTVNTEANFNQKTELAKGTKAYYDNIRKTDKRLYMSPDIQGEIDKASQAGTYVLDSN